MKSAEKKSISPLPVTPTECPKIGVTASQWNLLAGAGLRLPDVDWRRNALSAPQEDYCRKVVSRGPAEIRELLCGLRETMDQHGVCVVSFGKHEDTDAETHKRVLTLALSAVCRPFGPFLSKGFWQNLTVDPQAQNLRAHSIGRIPFHFDLDQASEPPDYVALYCARPDPLGGGSNHVVDYRSLFLNADYDLWKEMERASFSFSTLFGTYNVGGIYNPHPLIDMDFKGSGDWVCRYNGKARPELESGSKEAALFDILESVFTASSAEIFLNAGDLLLLDQRRVLHAREALAERPTGAAIPAEKDRLLLQVYGNS